MSESVVARGFHPTDGSGNGKIVVRTTHQLAEINFLRPLVIFLIVVLHSFTIYTGGWPLPEGIERNYVYMGIAKMSHSCILETFTMISGYLLAYNLLERGKTYRFTDFVIKKFQRLIVPALFFGILYKWLIDGVPPMCSVPYAMEIVEGVAHLWFLPMLFWCFLGTFFLLRWQTSERSIFCLLVLLCILPLDDLPLQLGRTSYYWFFFYIGFVFRKYCAVLVSRCQLRNILKYGCCFLVLFSSYIVLKEIFAHLHPATLWGEWSIMSLARVTRMIAALPGVYVLMLISLYFTGKRNLPVRWVHLNAYCFGIYLLHHFILPPLYYHTSLPSILGSYGLPWAGLFISLTLSLGLTMLLVRTRIGKKLMG